MNKLIEPAEIRGISEKEKLMICQITTKNGYLLPIGVLFSGQFIEIIVKIIIMKVCSLNP